MASDCTRCPLHLNARTVCIEGDGPESARLLVLGDQPGYEEDVAGKPFSSRSGTFLRRVIEGYGLDAETRYTYTVRCKSSDGANPTTEEIQQCRTWLARELKSLPNIEVIVPLGKIAQKALGIKGQTLRIAGIPTTVKVMDREYTAVPLASPGYVLKSGSYAPTWQAGWDVVRQTLSDESSNPLDHIGNYELDKAYPIVGEELALDIETTGLNPKSDSITAFGLSNGQFTYSTRNNSPYAFNCLRMAMAGKIIVHNAAFECAWAEEMGIHPTQVQDTMLMAKRKDPGRPANLDALTARILPQISGYKGESDKAVADGGSWITMNPTTLMQRNACDAWATFQIRDHYWQRMTPQEKELHYEDVAISLSVGRAARKGMYFDSSVAMRIKDEAEREMEEAQSVLPINPGSPSQVGELLSSMGVDLPESDKGNPKTGEIILRLLLAESDSEEVKEVARQILKYRGAQKIVGTYIAGFASRRSGDGYIRSDMRFPGTVTWRPSSSDPNLLNVPRGIIRQMFAAPPGYVVFEADYSQAELRIAAALSGDPFLCKAYREGLDVHNQTAVALFGDVEIDKEMRARAKTVNFGTIYGAGARTLWQQFLKSGRYCPLNEVDGYHKKFWRSCGTLDKFRLLQTEAARSGARLYAPTGGYSWTRDDLLLAHPTDPEEAARAVFNATIQCVPPRFVGRAMLRIEEEGVGDVRLHTYDGIVGYLPEDRAVEYALRIQAIMESEAHEPWWNGIPCPADIKIGPSWGELEEVDEG